MSGFPDPLKYLLFCAIRPGEFGSIFGGVIVGPCAEISRLFYSGLGHKILQRATVPIGAPFEDQLGDDSKKAEANKRSVGPSWDADRTSANRPSRIARRRSITANWNLTRDRRNAHMRAKARISCRPSFFAQLAFPRDALVRLVGMLDPVLELAVFFGKPLCHEV